MDRREVTVPDNGAVLVITSLELSALRALMQQLDEIEGPTISADYWGALYQLAREVREI